MNLIQFFAGGHRLKYEDILFVQAAFKEVLTAMAKVKGDSYILSGCEVLSRVGGTTTLDSGYVVLDGEVCAFDGGTMITAGEANYSFLVTETLSGGRLYRNEVARNIYKTRKATLVAGDDVGNWAAMEQARNWTVVTPEAGVSFAGLGVDPAGNTYMRYIKIGNEVIIRGQIRLEDTVGDGGIHTLFTLPEGSRPLLKFGDQLAGSLMIFDALGHPWRVLVNNFGAVRVINMSGADRTNTSLSIHDFRFTTF